MLCIFYNKKLKKKPKPASKVSTLQKVDCQNSHLQTFSIYYAVYISHLYIYNKIVKFSHPKFPCKIWFHFILCYVLCIKLLNTTVSGEIIEDNHF